METAALRKIMRTAALHILITAFLIWVWRCPFFFLTGIPCPGCGVTRAWLAFFQGHVFEAFRWNPVFLPGGLAFLYAVHREKLPARLSCRTEIICGTAVLFAVSVCYIWQVVLGNGPVQADLRSGLIYRMLETLRGGYI